jgi:hypothetical protein
MTDYDNPDAIWDGIEPCGIHALGTELERAGTERGWDVCPGCQMEMTARNARIEQISAEAAERMAGLAQAGVANPQVMFMAIRLEVLIEALMNNPRDSQLFEGEVARRTMLSIRAMQKSVSDQMLAPEKRLTVVKNGIRS